MPMCELHQKLDCQLDGTGAVAALEGKLRDLYQMRFALCVSSATMGLFGIALALDLRDAEFVSTPYTYGASFASWLLLGNQPRFADIDPGTLALDPAAAQRAITPKTRAILAVDVFGIPSDTMELRRVADEFGLWYIADAAQSFGATRQGKPASHLADALVVSFTAGKTLCAGEGGAILTNRRDIYEKLIWWTQHPHRQRRELALALDNEFALNARLNPLAAVMANCRFQTALAQLDQRRRQCFQIIDQLNQSEVTESIDYTGMSPSFFRLTAAWKRTGVAEDLRRELQAAGIVGEVSRYPIRLLYNQPAFRVQYANRLQGEPSCPNAERQDRCRFAIAV